jgi:hypothetical protein
VSGKRWPVVVMLVLFVMECAPFWTYRHFPTQDGPSHLYNAIVAAEYDREPVYQRAYEIRPKLAGNLLSHWLLTGLVRFVAPPTAEKLLLTLYAALLPLSFWYLLAPLSAHANVFALFAFLFLPSYFLHSGFWNFCLSVPLLLFAAGWFVRRRENWNWGAIAIFAAAGFLLYLAHALSWAVLGFLVVVATVWERPRRWWWPLATFLPPAALALAYATQTQPGFHFEAQHWLVRARSLGAAFLFAGDTWDIPYIAASTGGLVLLAAAGFRARLVRNGSRRGDWLLASSAAAFLLAFFGPDALGTLSVLRPRFSLYAWLLLVLWLATQPWSRNVLRLMTAGIVTAVVVCLLARIPWYRTWSAAVDEVAQLARYVPAGAGVVAIPVDPEPLRVNPLEHPAAAMTPRVLIDWGNYEATRDYFAVQFGPASKWERGPDSAEVVLLHSRPGAPDRVRGPEGYSGVLVGYELVRMSEPAGLARIYRRTGP